MKGHPPADFSYLSLFLFMKGHFALSASVSPPGWPTGGFNLVSVEGGLSGFSDFPNNFFKNMSIIEIVIFHQPIKPYRPQLLGFPAL
jgi:hypothetical protein